MDIVQTSNLRNSSEEGREGKEGFTDEHAVHAHGSETWQVPCNKQGAKGIVIDKQSLKQIHTAAE